MRVLIIENEIYLAQSIASKLGELGYHCDISSSIQEAFKGVSYDVVLLSTNISGQDIFPVIEAYRNAVVILMVSYISNDTVTKPLAAGAKDYILKPFMIEELIRKIEHYQEFNRLKQANETYTRYLNQQFKGIRIDQEISTAKLPLFIASSFQKYADMYAFEYARIHRLDMVYSSFENAGVFHDISRASDKVLLYISDFQALKKGDRKPFLDLIRDRKVIVSGTDSIEGVEYDVIEMKSDNSFFEQGDILPIEDYVKYIVLNYQHKFPDTELSKKLGISRKSLWEKRKKYGIIKKK